jgi:hypothetical protein
MISKSRYNTFTLLQGQAKAPDGIRNKKGMSSLEMASTSVIFVVIAIFSIDMISMIFGADFCDRACKDCARAAGQMSTPDDAVNAMNAAATAHPFDGIFIKRMYPELLIYQDYNTGSVAATPSYGTTSAYLGKNGPDNITPLNEQASDGQEQISSQQTTSPGPYVKVRTTLFMRIPVILTFFGTKLLVGNVDSDPQLYRFQSTYTFPITNTYVPN